MAEGARFPWKVQNVTSRGPACSYKGLSNPLPNPPNGLVWVRDDETREWSLKPQESPPPSSAAGADEPPPIDARRLPEHCDYLEHVVSPTDTMQGICLRYRIDPTALRQANGFSGSNLRLAPERLVIPLERTRPRKDTGDEAPEHKIGMFLRAFRAEDKLSRAEAKAYLETSNWNVEDAIADAKADLGWETKEAVYSKEHKETTSLIA